MPVALSSLVILTLFAVAQPNAGSVRGVVVDQSRAAVAGAVVRLTNPITGYSQIARTDSDGTCNLVDVPFNRYVLSVDAPGFEPATRDVTISARLPLQLEIELSVAGVSQQVDVHSEDDALLNPRRTGPSVIIDLNRIERFPTAQPSRSTEQLIATAPGWTLNANGRLHARGIEYQVQYSIDGIPVTDTIAATFAGSPDPRNFRSVEVTTANIPAEYGNKLAGVIAVNTRSGLEGPTRGGVSFSAGSFSTFETAFDVSGRTGKLGYLISGAGSTTNRFLDPPAIENLHNDGDSLKTFLKLDYEHGPSDLIRFNLMANRTGLEIPNFEEQQAAGQDQRRQLRDYTTSVAWQRVFNESMVGNVAGFYRYSSTRLSSNTLATPVFTEQSRHHSSFGMLGSLTYQASRHTLKTGIEMVRFPVTEAFTFAVTDLEELRERVPDLTEETEQFTLASAFFFNESRTGWQGSAYFQDDYRATERLTLSLGVRFDSYNFLVSGNHVSPRLGAAFYIPKTRTVLRASIDRLIETPAVENLLLSSSEKTRVFSPVEDDDDIRGAPVPLARSWQFDVGFQQQITRHVRLDADFYYRRMRNNAEIINFLESDVVFPATLARSRSLGVESRLELVPVRGFSGSVSYTNLNIFGVAPITGGLFLGEAAELREIPNRRIRNEEDQRNTVVFEGRYELRRWRTWFAVIGRHDSGYAIELEDDFELEDFERRFPAKLLEQVNLERGFVKPRSILSAAVGKDFALNEGTTLTAQFNVENLTDRFYVIVFGSLFTGTNVGRPRSFSGRIGVRFN